MDVKIVSEFTKLAREVVSLPGDFLNGVTLANFCQLKLSDSKVESRP